MRVVIDTDPGLDDAVGILFALADKRFSVAAMTAVAGNIGISITTRNIGRLLAAMGRRDVTYAAGAASPLAGEGIDEEAIHGPDGLGGIILPEPIVEADRRPAAELLAELLRTEAPGTLSVLALGPLTNLARLALDAPDAYARIGRILAMGGTIAEAGNAGPFAEFNLAADPHAARVVFEAGVPVTLIPLDVTRKVRATMQDLDRLSASNGVAAKLSAELIRAYFMSNAERVSRPLHDPCVMVLASAPELFGTEMMRVSIDCDTHKGRLVRDGAGAPIEVARTVDGDAALDLLWRGLGAG